MNKKTLTFILYIIGFALFLNIKNAKAQIYDEENGICKVHPNYEYEVNPESTPLHLALARIIISECGYDCEVDHRPIYEVLKNRSRDGVLRIEKMMAYSPYSFNYHSNHRTKYIPYLNELGEKPLYWEVTNPRLKWEDFRDRWLRVLDISRRLVAGEQMRNPCTGRVDHWGARTAAMEKQARENGNVPANCVGTRNAFWTIDRKRRIELTRGNGIAMIEQ